MLCGELTLEHTSLAPTLQFGSYHRGEQLFSFNQGHLHVSMRIAVEGQLLSYAGGQRIEYRKILVGYLLLHEVNLLRAGKVLGLRTSQYVVEFGNQFLDSRNKLDESFRDNNGTEVVAVFSTTGNCIGNIFHYVVESEFILLHLF